MISTLMNAIQGLNEGNLAGFEAMLADHCHVMYGDRRVAATRSDFIDTLALARQAGVERQTVVSAVAHGNVVAVLGRDDFADGQITREAGIFLFDDAGKVVAIRGLD